MHFNLCGLFVLWRPLFFLSNSQLKAPGLTTMINGKNKTLYMQVGCFIKVVIIFHQQTDESLWA